MVDMEQEAIELFRHMHRLGRNVTVQMVNGKLMTTAAIAKELQMPKAKVSSYSTTHGWNLQATYDWFNAMPVEERQYTHGRDKNGRPKPTDEEEAERYAIEHDIKPKKQKKEWNVHGDMMSCEMIANHFGVTEDAIEHYKCNHKDKTMEEVFDFYHIRKLKRRGFKGYKSTDEIVQKCIDAI